MIEEFALSPIKQDEISFQQIKQYKNPYQFPNKQEDDIRLAVFNTTSIETLIKYIHYKFHDQGLLYTLIHKLYAIRSQIQFYVPQLVYIAIKKQCKPMKKMLCYRALKDQNLHRLILWNLKAFTVLMKLRDQKIKIFVQQFEQELINKIQNKSKFNHAQKAIAMLTTASLVLKKLPQQSIKANQFEKLRKFIKRFNSQYLTNLQHKIIIPFRKDQQSHQHLHSNYVVRIIDAQCQCFPTRKRVPYRIMFQTINQKQLTQIQPDQKFYKQRRPPPDKQNDLFDLVTTQIEKMFNKLKFDNKYPFVQDAQQYQKIQKLTQYAMNVQRDQQEQQRRKKKKFAITQSFLRQLSKRSQEKSFNQDNTKDRNLKRFQATYIPTIPAKVRKSTTNTNLLESRSIKKAIRQKKKRWSVHSQSQSVQSDQVKVTEEITNWQKNINSVWGQSFKAKKQSYLKKSYFHKFKTLRLRNVVVKGGDDLRQQIICMQIIYKIRDILRAQNSPIVIKPYEIIVLSQNSGLLQFVQNSISLDGLKKKTLNLSLQQFFIQTFTTEEKLKTAKQNFIESLAGSSILTYILKLKDRHNGNILLDSQGNIIHIDFGFILGMSPGGLNFQTSPFKLTQQYLDLMGGTQSSDYQYFVDLFCSGMGMIRKKWQQICLILDIMKQQSDLQCFQKFQIQTFKNRFKLNLDDINFNQYCKNLIEKSCNNSRTIHYDNFQYYTNGIAI